MEKQVYTENSILYIVPTSLTLFEINELQELCIEQLQKQCTQITINLKDVEKFDIAGLQFIKSLQNYTELNGIEINILDIPQIVQNKLSIIGATL